MRDQEESSGAGHAVAHGCRVRPHLRKKERLGQMGQFDRDRRYAAVAIRADGRRVPVQLPESADVSILAKLETIGLGLLALITGSRREPGGRRR